MGEAPEALREDIGFILNRAARQLRERLGAALAPLAITPRHYALLSLLAEACGLTQQQAGGRAFCDRTTTVNVMDDLERLGLARRVPRPDDRRAHMVQLTGKGRQAQARARTIARRVNADYLRPLTGAETRQLRALLLRLTAGASLASGGGRRR
jgi:DNA-binding MarR family transcriptional regulator